MKRAVILGLCVAVAAAITCSKPPPAQSFEVESFYGTWYEIGRIQTAGVAARL